MIPRHHLAARSSLDRSPEGIDSPANNYLAPAICDASASDVLVAARATLRTQFRSYNEGWMTGQQWRAAIAEYSKLLRESRAAEDCSRTDAAQPPSQGIRI